MILIALRWKLQSTAHRVQLVNIGTIGGYSELSLLNDKDIYKEILSPATIKLLRIIKGNSFYRLE